MSDPAKPWPHHDWRWGEIDNAGRDKRTPLAVCWACEWVAWNELEFNEAIERPCEGHPGRPLNAAELRTVRWLLHFWDEGTAPEQRGAKPPTWPEIHALEERTR